MKKVVLPSILQNIKFVSKCQLIFFSYLGIADTHLTGNPLVGTYLTADPELEAIVDISPPVSGRFFMIQRITTGHLMVDEIYAYY